MDYVLKFFQLFVAFGLLNVWIFRSKQKTPYRGSDSQTLKDEFLAYGLPLWFFYFVGCIKITAALFLLLGLWIPFLVLPAALVVSIMMVGALSMHLKVRDPLKKSLPAFVMLLSSIIICVLSLYHR